MLVYCKNFKERSKSFFQQCFFFIKQFPFCFWWETPSLKKLLWFFDTGNQFLISVFENENFCFLFSRNWKYSKWRQSNHQGHRENLIIKWTFLCGYTLKTLCYCTYEFVEKLICIYKMSCYFLQYMHTRGGTVGNKVQLTDILQFLHTFIYIVLWTI